MKLKQMWGTRAVPFRYAFYIMYNHVGKGRGYKLSVLETCTTMQYHFCIMLQLKFGNLSVSEG